MKLLNKILTKIFLIGIIMIFAGYIIAFGINDYAGNIVGITGFVIIILVALIFIFFAFKNMIQKGE